MNLRNYQLSALHSLALFAAPHPPLYCGTRRLPWFGEAIDQLYSTDVFEKRNEMNAAQRRSEDWLFRMFMPDLQLESP